VDVDRLQAQVARAQIRVSHGDVGAFVKSERGGAGMGQQHAEEHYEQENGGK
jgi:hypothetical protein